MKAVNLPHTPCFANWRVKLQTWPASYSPSRKISSDLCQFNKKILRQKWGGHVQPSTPRCDAPGSRSRVVYTH